MPEINHPPSIYDPKTGKTFVAIPAPPFVSAKGIDSPHFIYIEQKNLHAHRLYASGQPAMEKPSLHKWVNDLATSDSPPDHVPWAGADTAVTPSSSRDSLAEGVTLVDSTHLLDSPIARVLSTIVDSNSGSDLPDFDSGSCLLKGSLPSLPSTVASSAHPTAVSSQTQALQSKKSDRPATSVAEALSGVCAASKRRAFSYGHRPSVNREALVFERQMPLKVKRAPVQVESTSGMAKMMAQLHELNEFFDDGMKAMDTSMHQLDQGKSLLATPSLVLSNSTATVPLSLESYADFQTTVPLALRRGKRVPPTLAIHTLGEPIEYPGIPSPFRGSPVALAQDFDMRLTADPLVVRKTTLSTNQMIASLRAQVDRFRPKSPRTPQDDLEAAASFQEAEMWLNNEINLDFCDQSADGSDAAPMSPGNISDASEMQDVRFSQADRRGPAALVQNRASTVPLPQPHNRLPSADNNSSLAVQPALPRAACLRRTTADSCVPGSTSPQTPKKRVRFSTLPPLSIPPAIAVAKHATAPLAPVASAAAAGGSLETPSPQRKSGIAVATSPAPFAALLSSAGRRMSTGSALLSTTGGKCASASAALPGRISMAIPSRSRPSVTGRSVSLSVARGLPVAGVVARGKENRTSQFVGKEIEGVANVRPRRSPLQSMLSRFKV